MTNQSHDFADASKLDPITALMGTLPPEELDLRLKLYQAGRLASFMPYETESPLARSICSLVCDLVREWQFAPAQVDDLEKVAKLARRLTICANDAQLFEAGA
ncbi:hypothetical protein [Novosphingobium sp. KN65.2]|uniref:hypothetical protein n=1 Tax=Novosphingobium sp. KN65.2 TaxID=1478134 RepID=UPI0005E05DEE|nr:hypothetical protein [Novosphingobium sp. KN65.2]CDO38308.1 hypothetical protein SPHV1_550025 [Novosphingobium sp. KN65.2]